MNIKAFLRNGLRIAVLVQVCLLLSLVRSYGSASVSVLHSFTGPVAFPNSKLVLGDDGNLYGTTRDNFWWGETYAAVIKVTPGGTVTVLHRFTDEKITTLNGLIKGGDGELYGTSQDSSIVFKISTDGTVVPLHTFLMTDGATPKSELTLGHDGNYYGTTTNYGGYGYGTVFQMKPDGTYTVLHSFTAAENISNSTRLIQDASGNFYASSPNGGAASKGCVYQITPAGVVTILHSFSASEGNSDLSALKLGVDGCLYGTTSTGPAGLPTAYKISTAGAVTPLHTFSAAEGSNLSDLCLYSDGYLYGSASSGGAYGQGTIFKMSRYGAVTKLISLDGNTSGAFPSGLTATNGGLFGACITSGSNNYGTIFNIAGGTFSVISSLSFTGPDGYCPAGSVVQASDGNYYGTTWLGGAHDKGTVFRVTSNGSFATIYSFSGPDGSLPWCSLALGKDGNLYGSTTQGGTTNNGTLFKISLGGALTTLHSFDGVEGRGPAGPLVFGLDGSLYGGVGGDGGVFKYTTWGSLVPLHNYSAGYTYAPFLTLGAGGVIYGTSETGSGAFGYGEVFKIDPVTGYQVISTLSSDKSFSYGVAIDSDGALYSVCGNEYFELSTMGQVGNSGYLQQDESVGRLLLATNGYFYNCCNSSIASMTSTFYDDSEFGRIYTLFPATVCTLPGQSGYSVAGDLTEGKDNFLYATYFAGGVANFGETLKVLPLPDAPTVKVDWGNNAIRLGWKNTALGSATFNVYRSTTAGAEGDVPYRTGLTTPYFTDNNVVNGNAYYYQVTQVNQAGEGARSTEVTAWPFAPSVTFATTDAATRGDWVVNYGANGRFISGAGTSYSNPSAGSISMGQVNSGVWSTSVFDTRCLENGDGRIAGVSYQTSWKVNVNSKTYQPVALYFLDINNVGFAETVKVTDAVTGQLLDTRSVSGFQNGKYLVWNITGDVNITLTSTAGHWAVLSGIFLGGPDGTAPYGAGLKAQPGSTSARLTWSTSDGAYWYHVYRATKSGGPYAEVFSQQDTAYTDAGLTPGATYYYRIIPLGTQGIGDPSSEVKVTIPLGVASFQGFDQTTLGNWKGNYGYGLNAGYNVIGDPTAGNPNYPSYATVKPGPHNVGVWTAASLDRRCLLSSADGSANRLAGVWFQTSWYINFSVTGDHLLSLYLVDQPNAGYGETVTITDTATGIVLDSEWAASLYLKNGVYAQWHVSGNITVTFTSTSGHWAVLSGIFFDGDNNHVVPPVPTGVAASPSSPGINVTWNTTSYATSYNIYRGTTAGGESPTPIATGITTTSYQDNAVTTGTTYYYKVVAVNGVGGGFASTEASATAP